MTASPPDAQDGRAPEASAIADDQLVLVAAVLIAPLIAGGRPGGGEPARGDAAG
jgi:hypothetical protein